MGELDKNWLSVEIESVGKEIGEWSQDLRESYESMLEGARAHKLSFRDPTESGVPHQNPTASGEGKISFN